MDCNKCMEQMSLHLDNIADVEENEFRQHLRSCKKCRTLYERMASTREHLSSLPEEEVPEGFHDAWLKKAIAQKAKVQKPNLRWVRIAGPIAAALVVAVVGWRLIASGTFTPPVPAPQDRNMALTTDQTEESAKLAPMTVPAPTMAATMAPAATAAPQPAMDSAMVGGVEASSANPFAASRQETITYTINGKPEAQLDLQDLLNQWKVSYSSEDSEGTTKIAFTIGADNYGILMDWLIDKGAQPPPSEKSASDNTGTISFEVIFN